MKNQMVICVVFITVLHIMLLPCLNAETKLKDSTLPANESIKGIKITSLAFGGSGVLFTTVNSQFTAMTGGRGSATFNNRYTFGGAGWGMPKGVEMQGIKTDTLEFYKFGYGGLEFGYLFYEGEKFSFGSNLLLACGAGFVESYPKSKGGCDLFPVFEPSVYSQINMGKLLKLDIGIKYRFIAGSELPHISKRQLSGPSVYLAFLVGTCNCN
jgi:hypothetical protein